MAISDSILSEFDQEMAGTRRTLERVPYEKFDWKPHDKSMSLGGPGHPLKHSSVLDGVHT
jgi:hypothetical protein